MALVALVLLPCVSRAAAQPHSPAAVPAPPAQGLVPVAPSGPAARVPAPAKPAAPPAAPAFPVEVAFAPVVTERAGEVTVGDRVEAILTVKLPAGQLAGAPRFPVWGESWGDVEVREKAPARKVSEQGGRRSTASGCSSPPGSRAA